MWVWSKGILSEKPIIAEGIRYMGCLLYTSIPMINDIRSLNLGNSVAIVLYEALRQNHFDHMQLEGDLHRLHWKG